MGLLKKAIIGLVVAIAAYHIANLVLFDLYIAKTYRISKENTAGKKVIVTGSSKGIGEALAYVYSEAGAHVVITGRSEHLLTKVAAKCKTLGAASVHVVSADLSKAGEAKNLVAKAVDLLGGLDIFIVNHIIINNFHTLGEAVTGIHKTLQVNLLSYIEAAQTALPALEVSAGSIVFVSSMVARMPIPYCYDYCMEKRALEGFHSTLRMELALNKSSIHVGLAALGLIDTQTAHDVTPGAFKTDISDQLLYASVDETARNIAALSLARVRELITPWWLRSTALMRDILPDRLEQQMIAISKGLK